MKHELSKDDDTMKVKHGEVYAQRPTSEKFKCRLESERISKVTRTGDCTGLTWRKKKVGSVLNILK